ncbi:hypothetical protein NGB58_17180 [Escherichia coli]|nr:hypothetical protein [Escherichia coli]
MNDKELIKEIKERIGRLDVRDDIERRAYEIALASLEAEPIAWLYSDNGLGVPAITRNKNIADSWLSNGWHVQPLYTAQPAPVVPDKLPREHMGRQPCHQITASMAKSIALKLGAELNNEEH